MTRANLETIWTTITQREKADFLVQPDRRYRFADLARAVAQWLAVFDAHGLAIGDRIVIRTKDEQAALTVFLAALLDGVVPVLLSADTPDRRLTALCETVEAALLIDDTVDDAAKAPAAPLWPALFPLAAPVPSRFAPSRFGIGRQTAMLPGLAVQPAARPPRLPADDAGLAYILFTSGTTAAPSGVCISRGNLLANLATLSRLFGYTQDSRIFNDMILAHADGMIQGPVLAAFNGCAVIRAGGFQLGSLEEWLNRVRATRATHVITVPTVWAMIDAYAAHDDYFDAPECSALLSVAAKLAEPLWQRLETRFKRPLFNQYGLTETVASALYAGPNPEMGARFTIGKPVDCDARIDPAATDEGELQLRGDNIFTGYWRDPERTAGCFTADGWFQTGDLGRACPDGSFEILGRLKTVIMSGGFLIRPDEIDEAMLQHQDVEQSVTIGMADAMFGEVPVTAIVARGAIDETALTVHARERLEARKVPRRFVRVETIPRGDSGKPNLAALRAGLAAAAPETTVPSQDQSAAADAVLKVAADVFRVAPEALSLRTAQGDVPGWDSFSQIMLVLSVEQALDVRIPAARVAAIRTLGDLVKAVEALRA